MSSLTSLSLLPLLPLAGFLVNGLFGSRLPRAAVGFIACGLPALAFVLTLQQFLALLARGTPATELLFTWAATAGFQLDAALYFDAATAVMCLVITGIGTLIHLYSVGYMQGDPGYARYFAYLNLFLFFMLVLVLGKNLVVMFVGWEGVGLASYLLIGFWFQDSAKVAAATKAFIVNRVGDTGFLLAAFLLQATAGTLDFQAANAFFASTPPAAAVTTTIGLLLLLGACGKSAQIPLHVWLPDAMAGPTPVSALIHAATMVTAGVYLLARLNGLFLATPDAMAVVAWLGGITALAGATMGVTAFNLKKVLAYSTMSQIGLMVMACGLGAFSVGMFHLTTHAFFKACLFLGAGAVLHALGGEEDMRRMGGLARELPFTFGVFLVATLALCGLPPFAGFFSKDEILWTAWAAAGGSPLLWAVGSAASFLTAFYMFRAIFMTFFGTSHVSAEAQHHLHEPPWTMSVVLALLALGSTLVGLIGLPQGWRELLGVRAPFYDLLEPVLGQARLRDGIGHSTEWVLMCVAVAVALAGIALAWLLYGGRSATRPTKQGALQRLVASGYQLDALYDRVFVRGLGWLSANLLQRGVEGPLASGTVRAPAVAARAGSRWLSRWQTGNLQAYVAYALVGLVVMLAWGFTRV
jgi:NADH-quinone oxidoreductase subunit L